MKKDWRYYINVGSKGNMWNDLYHTPDRRRPLVITPTVIRGFETQESVNVRHEQKEADKLESRQERVLFEREQRRWQLEVKKGETQALESKAGQVRKITSAKGPTKTATEDAPAVRPASPSRGGASRVTLVRQVPMTMEVPRPASGIVGKMFQPFEFTTLLTQDEWGKAVSRRETTKEDLKLNIERPDLVEWGREQERNKASLEEDWVRLKSVEVQANRQERKMVEEARMERRRELERMSGQSRVREALSRHQSSSRGSPQTRRAG